MATATAHLKQIPSLGSTSKEIFQRWRELSETDQFSFHTVVGWIPGEGIYSWRHGEIVREFKERGKRLGRRGCFATFRPATPDEINRIHRAIDIGAFQAEARQVTGCLGYCTNPDAGATVKVYHQATGRRLQEQSC